MTDLLLRFGAPEAWVQALHLDLLLRLLLASVLGGMIGLEREVSGKPAGLRTNLLICVGAALLMELSLVVSTEANLANAATGTAFRADPARIAAQIVSGIGFLGAGTILQSRGNVTGLTTAATLWVVAAIGMAVGAKAYVEAIGSTVLVMASLVVLGRLENVLIQRRRRQRYLFTLEPEPELLEMIETTFRRKGLRVESESLEKGDTYEAVFEVAGPSRRHQDVLRVLAAQPGIRSLSRAP